MGKLWEKIKVFLERSWKTRNTKSNLKGDMQNSEEELSKQLEKLRMNKEIATKYAWSYLGIFYKWGGDDPSGFDCSGLCGEILQAVGLVDRGSDYTAQGLYNKFYKQEVIKPEEGCLVLYGKDKKHIIHVEYCISEELSIGASGGGSKTLTVEDAIRQNAFIKIRPIRSRRDIVAYINPFL